MLPQVPSDPVRGQQRYLQQQQRAAHFRRQMLRQQQVQQQQSQQQRPIAGFPGIRFPTVPPQPHQQGQQTTVQQVHPVELLQHNSRPAEHGELPDALERHREAQAVQMAQLQQRNQVMQLRVRQARLQQQLRQRRQLQAVYRQQVAAQQQRWQQEQLLRQQQQQRQQQQASLTMVLEQQRRQQQLWQQASTAVPDQDALLDALVQRLEQDRPSHGVGNDYDGSGRLNDQRLRFELPPSSSSPAAYPGPESYAPRQSRSSSGGRLRSVAQNVTAARRLSGHYNKPESGAMFEQDGLGSLGNNLGGGAERGEYGVEGAMRRGSSMFLPTEEDVGFVGGVDPVDAATVPPSRPRQSVRVNTPHQQHQQQQYTGGDAAGPGAGGAAGSGGNTAHGYAQSAANVFEPAAPPMSARMGSEQDYFEDSSDEEQEEQRTPANADNLYGFKDLKEQLQELVKEDDPSAAAHAGQSSTGGGEGDEAGVGEDAAQRLEDKKEMRKRLMSMFRGEELQIVKKPLWRWVHEDGRDPSEVAPEEVLRGVGLFRAAGWAVLLGFAGPWIALVRRRRQTKASEQKELRNTLALILDQTATWMARLVRVPIASVQRDATLSFSMLCSRTWHRHNTIALMSALGQGDSVGGPTGSLTLGRRLSSVGRLSSAGSPRRADSIPAGDGAGANRGEGRQRVRLLDVNLKARLRQLVKLQVRVKGVVDGLTSNPIPAQIVRMLTALTAEGNYFDDTFLFPFERTALKFSPTGSIRWMVRENPGGESLREVTRRLRALTGLVVDNDGHVTDAGNVAEFDVLEHVDAHAVVTLVVSFLLFRVLLSHLCLVPWQWGVCRSPSAAQMSTVISNLEILGAFLHMLFCTILPAAPATETALRHPTYLVGFEQALSARKAAENEVEREREQTAKAGAVADATGKGVTGDDGDGDGDGDEDGNASGSGKANSTGSDARDKERPEKAQEDGTSAAEQGEKEKETKANKERHKRPHGKVAKGLRKYAPSLLRYLGQTESGDQRVEDESKTLVERPRPAFGHYLDTLQFIPPERYFDALRHEFDPWLQSHAERVKVWVLDACRKVVCGMLLSDEHLYAITDPPDPLRDEFGDAGVEGGPMMTMATAGETLAAAHTHGESSSDP